jgi:hypothetical protein
MNNTTADTNTQNQSPRDKILQRIVKLRALAEDNGASEAEMNTALNMAANLMESYQVEEAEIALAEGEGRIVLEILTKTIDTSALNGKQRHKIILCLSAIGAFTQTKCVYRQRSGEIIFTGHRPDIEMANYLTALVRSALDQEYESYRKRNVAVGYGAKTAFTVAMSNRISTRLYDMAREAEKSRNDAKQEVVRKSLVNPETPSGTALVISEIAEMKRKEVEMAYAKAHPSVRTTSGFSYGRNTSAHSAGRAAGDRVNFGRPVSGGLQKKIA